MSFPILSRAIEGYLISLAANGRSENTIRNYRQELIRLTNWLGDSPIDKITDKQVEGYMIFLRDEFRITHVAKTQIKPKKLSQKSLSNAASTLSAFCKWLSKEYKLSSIYSLSPIRPKTKPILPLSTEEIAKLLQSCKSTYKKPKKNKAYEASRNTSKRDRAIILVLLDTGIRVSELCGISIGDVEFEAGRVKVTGKGNKTRYVYLGKISKQAVWSYLAHRFPNSAPIKDEPLFVDKSGIYRITRQAVLLLLKRLGTKCSILSVHPHRFRHTFAVEFLRNGGNVFELQQLLGHEDLDMVKRYVQLAQVDIEVIAKKASPVDRWRL